MSLLVIDLPGSREGLQISMGQRNVHISLQSSNQKSDFRLHQANPNSMKKTTQFSETGDHCSSWT